ncbi:hypothetical protein AVEN_152578-1 [Araneus ventricosus]|uniref:Uncharacterized protein n=1 Tax=Araneus ventricosus TaxID=182803 RepID=A0A4Y2FYT1_ARAVE|nr:hypothetical protein AVEN_152578-1 [Araneus ventricosus]
MNFLLGDVDLNLATQLGELSCFQVSPRTKNKHMSDDHERGKRSSRVDYRRRIGECSFPPEVQNSTDVIFFWSSRFDFDVRKHYEV